MTKKEFNALAFANGYEPRYNGKEGTMYLTAKPARRVTVNANFKKEVKALDLAFTVKFETE
jgi:hypothetical protein